MPTTAGARTIDPHHFGPLDDQSLPQAAPETLFSGAERFLGKGEIKRRTALWQALAGTVEQRCAADEQVLYVAPAVEKTGVLDYLALGMLVQKYHQVALVLTTSRVLEVLLAFDGKSISGRTRSFSWAEVAEAKLSLGRLILKPVRGKTQSWQLVKRGDRKLLKLLLPRITERAARRPSTGQASWPVLHCPGCGVETTAKAASCAACGTRFRSSALATGLSLAFPGAGLFYAGHPMLGFLDLLGELMLYVVFLSMVLVAGDTAALGAALGLGALLIALTKLESVHVGHVLLRRRPVETVERHRRWKRGAYAGAAVSVVLLALPLLGAGMLADVIDHDLDFDADATTWVGSRNHDDFELFAEDPDLRSQWFNANGWITSVFAYPLGPGQTPEQFHAAFMRQESANGANVLIHDSSLPAGFEGFRVVERVETEDAPVAVVHYFVQDPQGGDIHQLLTAVQLAEAQQAESAVRDLLAQAHWIDAPAATR